ncbi:MAG: tetratricopeptide repeat protein [Clostridiaceae bacterium]|jgi:tetratricopeptide (TPR) repeat protein|nr:tetratricopeptide repeat protein [Clostridiaceae bacterium]
MDPSVIEIRKIKYGDYVDKHPNKPYGYYALGELELICKSYDKAMTYFAKALHLNPQYKRANIGYIICLIQQQKYMQAVRHFRKRCRDIEDKTVLMKDLVHAICSDYPLSNPDIRIPVECKAPDLKGKIYRILWSYKISGNIVAGVLLALHFMNKPNNKLFENTKYTLYTDMVALPGIVESLRWHMVKFLSLRMPKIKEQRSVASLFFYIPSNDMSPEYANIVFSTALNGKNPERINRIRKSMENRLIPVTQENMWRYIYFARQEYRYNEQVMKDCLSLIRSGWVDPVIAEALNDMILLKMKGYTEKDLETLRFYGFDISDSSSL